MIERDYVLATNLARVGVLADVLRSIIPDQAISADQLDQVRRIIAKWQMDEFKALERRS